MKKPGAGAGRGPRALSPTREPVRRSRRGRWLVLLLLLGLGWAAYRMYPEVTAPAEATTPVRHGTLELTLSGEALVVRREEVHMAPAAGLVEPRIAPGRHVRVGTPVAVIRPSGGEPVPMVARSPGAVSFAVDGLEAALHPAALPWLLGESPHGPEAGWLQTLPVAAATPTGSVVGAGAPAFKVVDPAQVWLLVEGAAEAAVGIRDGERYVVQFPALGRETTFLVRYVSAPSGQRRLVALEADGPFPEEVLLPRRLQVRMMVERWTGLVVPLAALVQEGGRPGVWLRDPYSGGRRHVPVTVVGRTAEGAVVEGDLQENDLILVPLAPRNNAIH